MAGQSRPAAGTGHACIFALRLAHKRKHVLRGAGAVDSRSLRATVTEEGGGALHSKPRGCTLANAQTIPGQLVCNSAWRLPGRP